MLPLVTSQTVASERRVGGRIGNESLGRRRFITGRRSSFPTRTDVKAFGEVPFNAWSVDAAHLPGELDCRPLFRPLTLEVAGSSQFFARPFGSEMGARENGFRPLFFLSG